MNTKSPQKVGILGSRIPRKIIDIIILSCAHWWGGLMKVEVPLIQIHFFGVIKIFLSSYQKKDQKRVCNFPLLSLIYFVKHSLKCMLKQTEHCWRTFTVGYCAILENMRQNKKIKWRKQFTIYSNLFVINTFSDISVAAKMCIANCSSYLMF